MVSVRLRRVATLTVHVDDPFANGGERSVRASAERSRLSSGVTPRRTQSETLSAPAGARDVTLTLGRSGAIRGIVVDAATVAPVAATIRVMVEGTLHEAWAYDDGEFRITAQTADSRFGISDPIRLVADTDSEFVTIRVEPAATVELQSPEGSRQLYELRLEGALIDTGQTSGRSLTVPANVDVVVTYGGLEHALRLTPGETKTLSPTGD